MLLVLGPPGAQAKEISPVALEVRDGRLTLRARDAPLAVILERLAEAGGIAIHLVEPVQERVSLDLAEVALEEGLRRLLRHRNTLVVYNTYRGTPSAVYVFGSLAGAPAPSISARTDSAAAAAETSDDGEVDIETRMLKAALEIEALEENFRDRSAAAASPGLLQDLLADSEPGVRITTLQWLARTPEVAVDALLTALMDSDALMQKVAIQLILEHGVDDRQVEKVMAAAEVEDEAALRRTLSALLTR